MRYLLLNLTDAPSRCAWPGNEHEIGGDQGLPSSDRPVGRAQQSLSAIPADGLSDPPACHHCDPSLLCLVADTNKNDIGRDMGPSALIYVLKLVPSSEGLVFHAIRPPPTSRQTLRRFRPFALRLLKTLRPLAVLIRLRKPWTLCRLRLCG